jgi:hypothetical protein
MRTLFLDSGEFCAPALVSESFVEKQSAQLNPSNSKDLGEEKKAEAEYILLLGTVVRTSCINGLVLAHLSQ